MIHLRTRMASFAILSCLLISFSCNKETNLNPPTSQAINNLPPGIVRDWTNLSLDLASKSNGFNDLISSRALYYISVTMYESLLPGLSGYNSLQARINGFNTTLPQADPAIQYNWIIVANQALSLVCTEFYKSSGSQNLLKISELRDKHIAAASIGLDSEIISESKHLGNLIGWKIIDYSSNDGRADYYLQNFSDVKMPAKEGSWIPTPPDYENKLVFPYWGESRPALLKNVAELSPTKFLEYNKSVNSIMWTEAMEVYSFSTNLNSEKKDEINYWNETVSNRATPLCHNMHLFTQMLDEKDITLDKAVELFVLLSITHYDGFILAWNIKFKHNLLRPSTYIKQNINRYYIPEYSCMPVPEFVSSKALIYTACAEIFSHFFGHRSSFTDLTQTNRLDLIKNKRLFGSFSEYARDASYIDLYSANHFRTSIDMGVQLGYDLSQKTLTLKLKD
jgi:hypothetical protein